jgi:hypothetical protein
MLTRKFMSPRMRPSLLIIDITWVVAEKRDEEPESSERSWGN